MSDSRPNGTHIPNTPPPNVSQLPVIRPPPINSAVPSPVTRQQQMTQSRVMAQVGSIGPLPSVARTSASPISDIVSIGSSPSGSAYAQDVNTQLDAAMSHISPELPTHHRVAVTPVSTGGKTGSFILFLCSDSSALLSTIIEIMKLFKCY